MVLHPLTVNDRSLFNRFVHNKVHDLCGYAFENLFVWRGLFDIRWALIDKKMCLFFKDQTGMFMPLPPLGGLSRKVLDIVFGLMEDINHNRDLSRIENIEACDLLLYKKYGYRVYEKCKEYIVDRGDIASYPGDRFKDKRALVNYFKKNTEYEVRDYARGDRDDVVALYRRWSAERRLKNKDVIYQAMLDHSLTALQELLLHYDKLDVCARLVFCSGVLKGFTCGVPVSRKSFCVNFEFVDLAMKGLPAFIFSHFAQELKKYETLNLMDDSGIENIRKTKMSFRPKRLAVSYTALLCP